MGAKGIKQMITKLNSNKLFFIEVIVNITINILIATYTSDPYQQAMLCTGVQVTILRYQADGGPHTIYKVFLIHVKCGHTET